MAIRPLATLDEAAAWVDRVGLALLFPKPDVVLPSLWEAVAGHSDVDWAVRDADGRFVSFTAEMQRVWSWKDDLPRGRHACVGLHVVRTTALVAPRLVGALYALTGRAGMPDDFRSDELEPLERDVAEAALALGRPATRRELRDVTGSSKREVDRVVNRLQHRRILTNAGRDEEDAGWAATLHDLFARRWRARLRRLPTRAAALESLAAAVVRASGDVSAADLAAALRLRRREALDLLESLEGRGELDRGDDHGIAVWISRERGRARPASAARGRSRAAGSRSSPRRSP